MYREVILRNIEYEILAESGRVDCERLDELVERILDTVCSHRKSIRTAGDDCPAEVDSSRFLKLNSAHIEYILESSQIWNIKKRLLATLYSAPTTMDSVATHLSPTIHCTETRIGGGRLMSRSKKWWQQWSLFLNKKAFVNIVKSVNDVFIAVIRAFE